jgi:hypothetical protein
MTALKFLSSSCVPRISRHCTSGKPASIITENCRVNTARFLADGALTRILMVLTALTCEGVMRVTMICSRRRAETTASIVSPARSPLTDSPARVRPVNANVAITCCP